jgi:hypothetical protein
MYSNYKRVEKEIPVDVRVVKSDSLLMGKNENRVLGMRVYEEDIVCTCRNTPG